MSLEPEHMEPKEQFKELIQSEDLLAIRDFLNNQNISEVAELIYESPDYESQIIGNLSIHRASSTFKILDVPTQKRIIQELPPFTSAELLNDLSADDRTSFLEELPSEVVKELIKTLDPEERKITLSLLGYPEGSVGRLMTPDYIAVHKDWTVREVIDHIREVGRDSETIDVIYVVDDKGIFIDDIRIREIILANPDKKIEDVIDNRYIALNVNDAQETASEAFKMNNRVALPVLDDRGVLLGIVTIDDVLWITQEEFSEDIQKIGGTEALNEPYLEMPLLRLFRKRIVWLVILFLSEMLTTTAMTYFQDEIAKAVVLAIFVPLIISSGGNSGSQASTLIIQAMALGELTIADWWRVIRREFLSGLLLGAVLGIALVGVVLWGTIAGSMLPIVLKKFGADPATSSAPFVATLVDVTGIVIYFSVAYMIMQGILH